MTVTTILHPIYAARDARGFRQELGWFLPVARRSPTNYILVIGLVVAPTAALIGMRDQRSEAPFALTAISLALVLIGPELTSRLLAEPSYDAILRWDPDGIPADWAGSTSPSTGSAAASPGGGYGLCQSFSAQGCSQMRQ